MTDAADRLESIRERVEAATEGPWIAKPIKWNEANEPVRGPWVWGPHHRGPVVDDTNSVADRVSRTENAEFVAEARSDVPYLLSLVERVGEALAAISDQTWSHVEYDLGPRSDTTMMLLDALRDAAQEKNDDS